MILHVVTHINGGWAVVRDGAKRALKRFLKREDAIAYARERGGTIYIHRPDGMVEKKEQVSK